MDETRQIKCPDCNLVLGTVSYPINTPEEIWQRGLAGHACNECADIILSERSVLKFGYDLSFLEDKLEKAGKPNTDRCKALKKMIKDLKDEGKSNPEIVEALKRRK